MCCRYWHQVIKCSTTVWGRRYFVSVQSRGGSKNCNVSLVTRVHYSQSAVHNPLSHNSLPTIRYPQSTARSATHPLSLAQPQQKTLSVRLVNNLFQNGHTSSSARNVCKTCISNRNFTQKLRRLLIIPERINCLHSLIWDILLFICDN